MNVLRAGRSMAPSADCTATRPYSSQARRSPANAWAASAPDVAARPHVVTSTSFRRSATSATGPPSSPTTRVGTISATPTAPTASGERVRS